MINDIKLADTPYPRSLILGIDPGIRGALVLMHPGSHLIPPSIVQSFAMPVMKIPSRVHDKAAKSRVDPNALGDLMGKIHSWVRYAVIEEVGARPHQGVVSTFVFGHGTGIVHGCLGAFMLPFHLVRPEIWKLLSGTTADKQSSLKAATKVFGDEAQALHWPMNHNEGIAEAALIAHFGLRFMNAGAPKLSPPTRGDFAKELLE